jgi:hypothetical protein
LEFEVSKRKAKAGDVDRVSVSVALPVESWKAVFDTLDGIVEASLTHGEVTMWSLHLSRALGGIRDALESVPVP